jgi:hypothetical protein
MMLTAPDNLTLVVRAHHSVEARIQETLEHELPRQMCSSFGVSPSF